MKTKMYLLAAVAVFTASIAFAQTNAKKENKKKFEGNMEKESNFAVMAAEGGMFEIEAGNLAKTKATSDKVKELADHMVMDHTQANNELKQLASKKNIILPGKINDKAQKKLDELNRLNGADFDKEYAKEMVSDHKKDIELFQKEADKGKDFDLKNWAMEKLPVLKQHLSMAENTVDALNETATNK